MHCFPLSKRGLDLSSATIGRFLADAHARPHKVRARLNRTDEPGLWARAGDVCRLCLDPPPGTVLVSIDEKQASRPKPGSAQRSPPGWAGTPGGSSSAAAAPS
jgi:hypothetical protein